MTLGAAGLLVACGGNDAPKRQTTVVTGQVINRAADGSGVILWNLCDPISDNRLARRLADDGSFRFETDGITDYHNATLVYGDRFVNFFVSPGDSVHLTIDASKLQSDGVAAIQFSGANAAENRELNRIRDKEAQMLYDVHFDLNVEPDSLLSQVRQQVARLQDSMTQFNLSPAMQDFARRDILFSLANYLIGYRVQEDDFAAQQKVFGDSLFGIHDTTNFKTMMFPYHLLAYMQAKLFADSVLAQAFGQGQHAVMVRRGIELLGQEPASKSRDVMRWKFLSGALEQNAALYDSVPEMRSAFDDPSLNERLAELAARLQGAPIFPDTPMEGITYMEADSTLTEVPEGDFFAYLAARYPGKVLYIDVYSVWCGPCRMEMKFAPELHEAMHGKDVVFVNLCLSSDRETWQQMVAQQPVVGENYWFDQHATHLFMGTYDVSGFPTYILVGRDGKIVTMEAERPSHKEYLVKQLEEQLAR